MKQVVLAYSGGLDTSFCTRYLTDQGYEVHTVIVNTGGFSAEELMDIERSASYFGSYQHSVIDASREYYHDCIRYLIFGNVLRNRNYPLSVSSERAFQALKVIGYAQKNKIVNLAHGSTGAGNDQVRFESLSMILAPEINLIAPIRDLGITRNEEVNYLKDRSLEYRATSSDYSVNQGLWGTSVGGKETLGSDKSLPEEAWPVRAEPKDPLKISLEFDKGEPIKLNGTRYEDPVKLIHALDGLAVPFGIGRDIHTGETIIGIKGRVGFQAAAARILIDSHYSLEKHVLTKWQQYWKDQLGNWYGMFVHEAQFTEPVMRDIEKFLEHSQRYVTGEVYLTLKPFHFIIEGIKSRHDLMNPEFARYGEENLSWSAGDVKGFTRIMSNASRIFHSVNPEEKI